MLQRVYHQIVHTAPDAQITISTSKAQVSAIHNQSNETVSICVKPTRRDTFPAICLAATFLRDKKHVNLDETIIVCPVDSYVETSYYESVREIDALAQSGKAEITLMGIRPNVPSDKYGHIIPDSLEKRSHVKEFKEKPSRQGAAHLIDQGALWNVGVFGFKLSYIIQKMESIVGYSDYDVLYQRYEDLEKTSFDYAIVEREPSIQVLRYQGEWKDVGTWNMMSEAMSEATKGCVYLDEECSSVNAINELDIPILVMGAHNMIIAASGDGILVADKERSCVMKPYVEKIETDIHYAEKSWGAYNVINATNTSITVKVTIRARKRMSYHSHMYRDEIWTILEGSGVTIVR